MSGLQLSRVGPLGVVVVYIGLVNEVIGLGLKWNVQPIPSGTRSTSAFGAARARTARQRVRKVFMNTIVGDRAWCGGGEWEEYREDERTGRPFIH